MKQSDAMSIQCLLLNWNIRWKLNYPTEGKCPKMVIRTVESLSNTQTLSRLFVAYALDGRHYIRSPLRVHTRA